MLNVIGMWSAPLLLTMALAAATKVSGGERDVDLAAPDGTKIRATYYAADRPGPGVMLFHMCGSTTDRTSWRVLAEKLRAAGFHVLAMDYRGFGESGGPRHSELEPAQSWTERNKWAADVDAAYAYLAWQPGVEKQRMGAAGASCGVDQSVQLARRHSEVTSLALLSGSTDHHGREYLLRTPGLRILSVASQDDGEAVKDTKWELAFSRSAGNRFVEYHRAGHGTDMFAAEKGLVPLIVNWFDRTLRKDPAKLTTTGAAGDPVLRPVERFWSVLTGLGGIKAARPLYDEAKRIDPNVVFFPSWTLSRYGLERLYEGRIDEALAVLQLSASAYPETPGTHYSLAQAYAFAGKGDLAVKEAEASAQKAEANPKFSAETRQYFRTRADKLMLRIQEYPAAGSPWPETRPLWGALTPGEHGVGFAVRSEHDYSRAFRSERTLDGQRVAGETARPVQILVWYPAAVKAGARPLLFRDYVHLSARELSFEPLDNDSRQLSEKRYVNQFASRQYDRTALDRLLGYVTAAVADAQAAPGTFPLVVYAPGSGGNAFEASILCEYLASHGYVVAAIPSVGSYGRAPNVDPIGFESYARDIEFTMAVMRRFPSANANNVALIGFSMGGSANTLVQMRNMNIHAAVYLDTGLPFRQFMDEQFKNTPGFDRAALRAPQLYLIRRIPQIDPEFAADIRHAEVFTLFGNRDYFRHADYTDDGMLVGVVPGLLPEHSADRNALNETVSRYTLQFLNAYLKQDARGAEFLKRAPEENGAPERMFEWRHKPPLPASPRSWELLDLLQNEGVARFRELYAQGRTAGAPAVAERTLNSVGYELLFQGANDRAIEVFELVVELYPASANARDSLSEGYETIGDVEKARTSAQRALELLPGDSSLNDAARQNLRQILEQRVRRLRN